MGKDRNLTVVGLVTESQQIQNHGGNRACQRRQSERRELER